MIEKNWIKIENQSSREKEKMCGVTNDDNAAASPWINKRFKQIKVSKKNSFLFFIICRRFLCERARARQSKTWKMKNRKLWENLDIRFKKFFTLKSFVGSSF